MDILYAYIQFIAFGIFFPLGAIFFILQKKLSTNWLYYNLIFQGIAILMVLAGFVVLYMNQKAMDTSKDTYIFHKLGGVFAVVTGTFYTFYNSKVIIAEKGSVI